MAAVATGAEAATATLVAGTAGWAALVIAIVAAGYAIYSYVTAEEKLKGADERRLNQLNLLIKASQEDVAALRASAEAHDLEAVKRGQVESALLRLDPIARAHIVTIGDEIEKRRALADAMDATIQGYQKERDVQIKTAAIAASQAALAEEGSRVRLEQLLTIQKRIDTEIKAYEKLDYISQGLYQRSNNKGIAELRLNLQDVESQINTLGAAMAKGNPEFETQAGLLADSARRSHATGEEIVKLALGTSTLSDANKLLASRIDEINKKLEINENRYKGAAGAALKYKEALEDIKIPDIDAIRTTEGLGKAFEILNERLKNMVDAQGMRETVRANIDALKKLDRQAKETYGGEGQKAYNSFIKTLPQVTQDALRMAGSMEQAAQGVNALTDKPKRVETELQKLQKRVNSLTADIESFRNLGTEEFRLRFKAEDLERQKRDLEKILNLRYELNKPLDSPLPEPTDNNAIQAMLRNLESQKRIQDGIRDAKEVETKANEQLQIARAKANEEAVSPKMRQMLAEAQREIDLKEQAASATARLSIAYDVLSDRHEHESDIYRLKSTARSSSSRAVGFGAPN
jgi:archaellum component FlaC